MLHHTRGGRPSRDHSSELLLQHLQTRFGLLLRLVALRLRLRLRLFQLRLQLDDSLLQLIHGLR